MTRFWQHFISNGPEPADGPPAPEPIPSDDEALDAYSRVIVRVAETLRPAVVNLRAGKGRDMRTGEVSGQPGEMVRTCVNAPEGAVEIAL